MGDVASVAVYGTVIPHIDGVRAATDALDGIGLFIASTFHRAPQLHLIS